MRSILITIAFLLILPGFSMSQDVTISGFPIGVGKSVHSDFFKPHYDKLQAVADTLSKYPLYHGVITGGADGETYNRDNDAKNPALALGRAHALRNLLIDEFKVNPEQLSIVSEDVRAKGPQYRYVSIRIEKDIDNIETRVITLEQRPPVEKHFTEIREIPPPPPPPLIESFSMQFGAGLSSSPFGGIPMISGALMWKNKIQVECIFGHTFWNSSFMADTTELDTKRRLAGAQLIYYPDDEYPIGIIGGWIRTEEISQRFYEYVRLSEGPMVGVRVQVFEYVYINAYYNPSKHKKFGSNLSESDNDQFMISATAFISVGGEK